MSGATLLTCGIAVARDRVPAGRGRRAVARPDEDALTLAIRAAADALRDGPAPTALILATTSAPYDTGGSAQVLAEVLDLQGDLFVAELTATPRDGLAALRVAAGLVAAGQGPVLVCAAHADASERTTGAGAVALLLGRGDGLGTVEAVGSHVEELRDRWRLRGHATAKDADRSFVQTIGTAHLARTATADAVEGLPLLVTGPDARSAATLERERGGPGDAWSARIGTLGAAHALLRLVVDAEHPSLVLALGSGLAETVRVDPSPDARARRDALRESIAASGREADGAEVAAVAADFAPYASVPRSWRDRAADLRLADVLPGDAPAPGLVPPRGRVVTWTRDHVYPGAASVEMVAVDLDGGGRFFGQVAVGEAVAMGDRVELVPRHLHDGGGMKQYYWKVAACR